MPDDEPDDETVREAIEQSEHGAPAAGAVLRDRFETHEVFQRIIAAADEEATTGARELFFSSLAAGFSITVTFLLYASLTASTDSHPILSALLYPLGFVFIILGGYQLYTENTLPPVVLVLERLMSLPRLFKIWGMVVFGNFVGGGFGALVLARTGVLSPDVMDAAVKLSQKGIDTAFWPLVFKAAFAGFIVAGVVWLVYAVRDSFTRFVIVYIAFLSIPLGNLYHSVVSFTELAFLTFAGYPVFFEGLVWFVLPVLAGNTVGGVLFLTVVNYFQTTQERLDIARRDGFDRNLSVRELLFGGVAGRTYVHKWAHEEREQE